MCLKPNSLVEILVEKTKFSFVIFRLVINDRKNPYPKPPPFPWSLPSSV